MTKLPRAQIPKNKPQSAAYAGSFDPFTLGHYNIVERMHGRFEEFFVFVAKSSKKNSVFSEKEKVAQGELIFKAFKNVKVEICEGLLVDHLKKAGVQTLIRGVRGAADLDYEMNMSQLNRHLYSELETLIVFPDPEFQMISGSFVREIAKNGGSLKGLVPEKIRNSVEIKMRGLK